MRRSIFSLVFSAAILLAASCTAELDPVLPAPSSDEAQLTVRLSAEDRAAFFPTKAAENDSFSRIWYIIADEKGKVIDFPYSKLSDDLSMLRVEGLPAGRYTLAFLAVMGDDIGAEVSDPESLSADWLSSQGVMREEFFYASLPVEIGLDQAPISENITLKRCVSAFKVGLEYSSPYLKRFVKSVRLTLDKALPTAMTAAGKYVKAESELKDIDLVRGAKTLLLFPADELSGYIEVESERNNGERFSRRYRIDGSRLEAGKITQISIPYTHPDENDGRIVVTEEAYEYLPYIDTMWLADEATSTMYGRSFTVNQPIQIYLNDSGRLQVRSFAAVPVSSVSVRARIGKISSQSFVLAEFEKLYPFMEAEFDLPLKERECKFETEDGRLLSIPAQPSLTASDIELSVDWGEDEYMKKIAQIGDKTWKISYANVSYSWSVDMTPALCRHAATLVINMAYMFSTEGFDKALQAYEGNIYANSKARVIPLDEIRGKIKNLDGVNNLRCGNCVGYGGMGGHWWYWLASYCWTGHYYDVRPSSDSADHNYTRQAIFHEFGHVLGYSHSDEMTYGDKWTVLCANEYCRQGREGLLPVNSSSQVNSLPM